MTKNWQNIEKKQNLKNKGAKTNHKNLKSQKKQSFCFHFLHFSLFSVFVWFAFYPFLWNWSICPTPLPLPPSHNPTHMNTTLSRSRSAHAHVQIFSCEKKLTHPFWMKHILWPSTSRTTCWTNFRPHMQTRHRKTTDKFQTHVKKTHATITEHLETRPKQRHVHEMIDEFSRKWQTEERWLESQGKTVHSKESGQNEWHFFEHQGVMATAPPCPERTLKNVVAAEKFAFVQGGRRPLGRDGRQAKAEYRFREDGQENAEIPRRQWWCQSGHHWIARTVRNIGKVSISIRQVAQQAMNENGQQIFEIFRQGEEVLCIASLARWNAQLTGLVELERRCRKTRQEVQVLSERLEIFKSPMEDKLMLQSRATTRYRDQIFEEIKELEEKKSEEALLLVQKRHDLRRYQNERYEARRLQSSGNLKRVRRSGWTCSIFSLLNRAHLRRWITTKKWLWNHQERGRRCKRTEWKETRGREENITIGH